MLLQRVLRTGLYCWLLLLQGRLVCCCTTESIARGAAGVAVAGKRLVIDAANDDCSGVPLQQPADVGALHAVQDSIPTPCLPASQLAQMQGLQLCVLGA